MRKNQKTTRVAGKPVEARLVVSCIMSDAGEMLAQWLLITNVQDVDTYALKDSQSLKPR
jgi:hypothetical protein